jgi:phage-related protein
MERSTPLTAIFYRTASGNEPVREWLQSLSKPEKFRVGVDIWKVQSEWPIGMPHVRPLGDGLHEVRSSLPNGIARVFFIVDGEDMVLLHGLTKKTQKTPPEALALVEKRRRDYEQNQEH